MRNVPATALGLMILTTAATASGTIPEPDLILYGQVCLPTGPATDQDNLTVTARALVEGQIRDVGFYRMGDEPAASDCHGQADCYVLRVRVETVPPGAVASGTAVVLNPAAPHSVDIFIKQGAAAEILTTSVPVDDRGVIRRLDLRADPVSADIDNNGQTNLADHTLLRAAWTGPDADTAQPCDRADINRDGHIDLRDYARLQNAFLGTGG